MSAALEQHVRFGSDFVFNYGPLGFTQMPMLGTGSLYSIGASLLLLLVALNSSLAFATLRRIGVSVHTAGATTAAAMLAASPSLAVEQLALFGVGYLVLGVGRGWVLEWPSWRWAVVALLAVGAVYVKVSLAPVAVVAVAAGAVVSGRSKTFVAGLSGMLSGVVLWMVAGQSPADWSTWLWGVVEIATGHVGAMNLPANSPWQYVVVVAVVFGFAAVAGPTAWRRVRHAKAPRSLVAMLIGTVLVWFLFRQGFTRAGPRSAKTLFAAAWLSMVWMPWRSLSVRRLPWARALVVVAAVMFVAADRRPLFYQFDPLRPAAELLRSASYVAFPTRGESAIQIAREETQREYSIPVEFVNRIGSASVHVDGVEIAATWAYGLTWRPMPSLQRYLGYTEHLDDRNAAFLRSTDAPDFILREAAPSIDGRLPMGESPAFGVEMFCRYRSVMLAEGWQLLERSTDRCGEPVEVQNRRVVGGETVSLPATAPNQALLVSFEEDGDLVDEFVSLVFKPLSNPTVEIYGRTWRMISATASTPALIRAPLDSGWGWQLGITDPSAEVIAFGQSGRVRVFTLDVQQD